MAHLRPVCPADDLPADQSIVPAIRWSGSHAILICKPSAYQGTTACRHGTKLARHRQAVRKRGKRTTAVYGSLFAAPLPTPSWSTHSASQSATPQANERSTTAPSPTCRDGQYRRPLATGGAVRREQIETGTLNGLKTKGYNLAHNFGHREPTPVNLFRSLDLFVFVFPAAAPLAVKRPVRALAGSA